jgi:hypothetical protein
VQERLELAVLAALLLMRPLMEVQLENVKKELLSKTAEEYRDSAVSRARLKQGLSQLANQAKQLAKQDATELVQRFGELGRRKFNLAA